MTARRRGGRVGRTGCRTRGGRRREVRAMHVVIRRYTGAAALIGEMERRKGEVEELIRKSPGFGAYYAVRTGADGLATITVCDSKAGTDESSRLAREWVQANVTGVAASPAEVVEGAAFVEFWR